MLAELDAPILLELGAGSGVLAAQLLNRLAPELPRLRYRILERSGELIDRQRDTLAQQAAEHAGRVECLTPPRNKPLKDHPGQRDYRCPASKAFSQNRRWL